MPVADTANHICCLIEVQGLLTERDCLAAIQRVVDRQEVLRLSFLPGKERPLQMIRKSREANCVFRDVAPADSGPERIEELAIEIFREPFDLVQGPLYRVRGFAPRAGRSRSGLRDSSRDRRRLEPWSFRAGPFRRLYPGSDGTAGAIASRAAELYGVGRGRARFLATGRAGATRRVLEIEARGHATDVDDADHARAAADDGSRRFPRIRPTRSANWLAAPDPHSSARCSGRSRSRSSKWTGTDDVLVGTPVANRAKQTTHETMGYFSNIVPLRGQIDRTRAVSDHLGAVHEATMESFANAMPFVELARALGEQSHAGT